MRQRATRYERAHNYLRSGHATAAALQTSCGWTVIDVPGVGHDGKRMSAAAAPIVSAAMHAMTMAISRSQPLPRASADDPVANDGGDPVDALIVCCFKGADAFDAETNQ